MIPVASARHISALLPSFLRKLHGSTHHQTTHDLSFSRTQPWHLNVYLNPQFRTVLIMAPYPSSLLAQLPIVLAVSLSLYTRSHWHSEYINSNYNEPRKTWQVHRTLHRDDLPSARFPGCTSSQQYFPTPPSPHTRTSRMPQDVQATRGYQICYRVSQAPLRISPRSLRRSQK